MEQVLSADRPVLHVVVIGFHHKKGCQIEYSYPPIGESINELPTPWKDLPSLALPDGAHNYTNDTIFFHLPSLTKNKHNNTVYGISCYRQIDSKDLLKKDDEVTRNTVQKSVAVLCTMPIYGLIKSKLELITYAYFGEKDFAQVSLLKSLYDLLNASLSTDLLKQPAQVFLGLSCRKLVQMFRHKILVIFKLMLLERKVIFYSTPAHVVCSTLLTFISLFPDLIEHGLSESSEPPSDVVVSSLDVNSTGSSLSGYLELHYDSDNSETISLKDEGGPVNKQAESFRERILSDPIGEVVKVTDMLIRTFSTEQPPEDNNEEEQELLKEEPELKFTAGHLQIDIDSDDLIDDHIEQLQVDSISMDNISISDVNIEHMEPPFDRLETANDESDVEDILLSDEHLINHATDVKKNNELDIKDNNSPDIKDNNEADIKDNNVNVIKDNNLADIKDNIIVDIKDNKESSAMTVDDATTIASSSSSRTISRNEEPKDCKLDTPPNTPTHSVTSAYGYPLDLFKGGILCHPYLSLQYYDIMTDPSVRGFVIGATNILFKQRRQLLDVVVELPSNSIASLNIEIIEPELRKQLQLSTADLRFVDNLVRKVCPPGSDPASDENGSILTLDTNWEGGDEWIRMQFTHYLTSLLATVSSKQEEKLDDDFNPLFVDAWKHTHNYRAWRARALSRGDLSLIRQVVPGHINQGQLSVSDMKIKLSQSMQSDNGKRLNAAVTQTTRVVAETGKAVGDVITNAKSAVSGWFRKATSTQ